MQKKKSLSIYLYIQILRLAYHKGQSWLGSGKRVYTVHYGKQKQQERYKGILRDEVEPSTCFEIPL
jgi:hypothetical protein